MDIVETKPRYASTMIGTKRHNVREFAICWTCTGDGDHLEDEQWEMVLVATREEPASDKRKIRAFVMDGKMARELVAEFQRQFAIPYGIDADAD